LFFRQGKNGNNEKWNGLKRRSKWEATPSPTKKRLCINWGEFFATSGNLLDTDEKSDTVVGDKNTTMKRTVSLKKKILQNAGPRRGTTKNYGGKEPEWLERTNFGHTGTGAHFAQSWRGKEKDLGG